MAPEWRARVAATCDTDRSAAAACLAGVPCHPSASHAQRVFDTVGACGLDFVTRAEWNHFPKARLAMTSGWGAPNSRVVGAEHVTLVHSFSEVLQSPATVNLQLFHRGGDDAPRLPRLPAMLHWPLTALLGAGEPCDMATRVSRAGAVTWWHLDDGGELVLQVCFFPSAPMFLELFI